MKIRKQKAANYHVITFLRTLLKTDLIMRDSLQSSLLQQGKYFYEKVAKRFSIKCF